MKVKKNKNKERSMYHHGLIQMWVEHELQQKGQSWKFFLWENGFISEIKEEVIQNNPQSVHQEANTLPPRRITRAMHKTKNIQEENEKEKEAQVRSFKGLQRKSRKSSNSSIGIYPYQKKFYDHLLEKEQMDKTPIFDESQDYTDQEDIAAANVQEDVVTPKIIAEEVHSPTSDLVTKDGHKSKKKIKKLKGKMQTLKVLERFLKNENILLKERNKTLVFENYKLIEDQAKLLEEHELVCHQALLWNKSRKELKKQDKKL